MFLLDLLVELSKYGSNFPLGNTLSKLYNVVLDLCSIEW